MNLFHLIALAVPLVIAGGAGAMLLVLRFKTD